MGLDLLAHYNLRTRKVEETRRFYVDVLGLREGPRPTFPFPGVWLYIGERDVLHVAGIVDGDAGLQAYLGDRGSEADLHGGGAIDHVAFTATGVAALIDRLDANGIPARFRKVPPPLDLYQIFVEDPNGVTLELNFPGAEAPENDPRLSGSA